MSKQKKTSANSKQQKPAREAAPPQRRKPTAGRPQVQRTFFDLDQGGAR
jgi:hypothetical protein